MKKFNKFLMGLCAVVLLTTGCSSNELKTAYTKMSVGDGEDQISGYTMSLRLFGLYDGKKIRESVRVQNYMGENYKVTYSSDEEEVYYMIDGVNYVYTENKPDEEPPTDLPDIPEGEEGPDSNNSGLFPILPDDGELPGLPNGEEGPEERDEVTGTYEKTDEDIPFMDTDLYLTSLKSAKKIGELVEEKIGSVSYNTYEFIVSKKTMKKLLVHTTLKDIKFENDIETKVWIDSEGYVYKITYDLASGIESDTTLELTVYYNSVNKVNEVTIDELNLDATTNENNNNNNDK